MIKRIIDISTASYLSIKHSQLLVEQDRRLVEQIPIEDIAALLLAHPAIVLTNQVIVRCQQAKTIVIYCDHRMMPTGVTLPMFESNQLHSRYLRDQTNIAQSRRKNLWKQVVQEKIKQQALTLQVLNCSHKVVARLASTVRSGDPDNKEAQAAVHYWSLILKRFKRDPNRSTGVNALLNYGYAVLRASLARAICIAGLHPTIGIYHRNQYNNFCLADDLMEPFRPWVDYMIINYLHEYHHHADMDKLMVDRDFKRMILQLPSLRVAYQDSHKPLMVALYGFMANFRNALNNREKLTFPQWSRQFIPSLTVA